MLVISDSSPLICFVKINKLGLLQKLFGEVIVPPIVYDEIQTIAGHGYDISEFLNAKWISVHEPVNTALVKELSEQIDAAEAQAIALAKEINPVFLLIDERRGTSAARSMGIKTIGVIGIIIRAKEKKLIAEGRPLLDELLEKPKFWISEELYRRALQLLRES